MGATRKKLHLIEKGFEFSSDKIGEKYLVTFKNSFSEFQSENESENKAIESAALKANRFIYANLKLFGLEEHENAEFLRVAKRISKQNMGGSLARDNS